MSDDRRLDQMQEMMGDLIRVVANTHAMVLELKDQVSELKEQVSGLGEQVAELTVQVSELKDQVAETNRRLSAFEKKADERFDRMEGQLFRVQLLERRQDKASARLEVLETYMEMQQEKQ